MHSWKQITSISATRSGDIRLPNFFCTIDEKGYYRLVLIDFGEARPVGSAPRAVRQPLFAWPPELVDQAEDALGPECLARGGAGSAITALPLNTSVPIKTFAVGAALWSMSDHGKGNKFQNIVPFISLDWDDLVDAMLKRKLKLAPLSSSADPVKQGWVELVADCLSEQPQQRPALVDVVQRVVALQKQLLQQ